MIDETDSLEELLDIEDVAQKRFLMYKVFDSLLDKILEDDIDDSEKLDALNEDHGYMYKLSQDFLNSSSTLEKHRKLEKIIEYVDRKQE